MNIKFITRSKEISKSNQQFQEYKLKIKVINSCYTNVTCLNILHACFFGSRCRDLLFLDNLKTYVMKILHHKSEDTIELAWIMYDIFRLQPWNQVDNISIFCFVLMEILHLSDYYCHIKSFHKDINIKENSLAKMKNFLYLL